MYLFNNENIVVNLKMKLFLIFIFFIKNLLIKISQILTFYYNIVLFDLTFFKNCKKIISIISLFKCLQISEYE